MCGQKCNFDEKRLIDANSLHERIKKNCLACTPGSFAERCYEDALNSVDEAPAIDPESLRGHAKWEKPKELFFVMIDGPGPDDMHEEPAIRCSNCGGMASQSDFDKWVWNFCPVCGCKMEDATNEQTEIS